MIHARTQRSAAVWAALGLSSFLAFGCGEPAAAPVFTLAGGKLPGVVTNSTTAHFEFTDVGGEATCQLDGGEFTPCTSTSSMDYANLTEGPHVFVVRVKTKDGRMAEARHYWNVELSPPSLSITAKPSEPSIGGAATFAFTASDASGLRFITCQVDDEPTRCTTSGAEITVSDDGMHTFKVQATDNAGNVTTQSATWRTVCTSPDFYVDAAAGNDSHSGTSSTQAFKTITKALTVATSGKTVKVLPGTYDAANGETFPLRPAAGVCLLGDPANKGRGTTPTRITGAGPSVDPSPRPSTLQPSNGAIVTGFEVTDGTRQNYLVFINEDGAIIHNNTLTGAFSGIFVTRGAANHAAIGNEISNCLAGLNYNATGIGKAELNVVLQNTFAAQVSAFSASATNVVDFGGGPTGSIGGNRFACSQSYDFWTNFEGPVYLDNNLWDNSPPTLETTQSCSGLPDICNRLGASMLVYPHHGKASPCP